MNNQTLLIKLKQRLNKLASNDYDNIECWQFVEAFNKGQVAWCRRNLHGENPNREGDEQSTSRIDDLQKLLVTSQGFTMTDEGLYSYSALAEWPTDYLRYKRVLLNAVNDCCEEPKRMTVYLVEEGNVDVFLDDSNIRPDFMWGETFATIAGNKLNVYHNKKFTVDLCKLMYYRQPRKIQISGCMDPYTNTRPTANIECEFTDDLTELLIDEAAGILAGDIENFNQVQRLNNNVDKNN